MRDSRMGKGKRVTGVFLILLGGGILLDAAPGWLGEAMCVFGAALFVCGFAELRDRPGR